MTTELPEQTQHLRVEAGIQQGVDRPLEVAHVGRATHDEGIYDGRLFGQGRSGIDPMSRETPTCPSRIGDCWGRTTRRGSPSRSRPPPTGRTPTGLSPAP